MPLTAANPKHPPNSAGRRALSTHHVDDYTQQARLSPAA